VPARSGVHLTLDLAGQARFGPDVQRRLLGGLAPGRKFLRRDPALRAGPSGWGACRLALCPLDRVSDVGTADPRLLASAFEFRGHGVVSFKRNCEILGFLD
jgi:hypothetical protein